MADYGTSDTSTTSLGANQFPISEVYVPNTGLKALGGGPKQTDGSNKDYAPALMYIQDGSDVTAGAQADAAVTDATQTNKTRMAFLKGLVKIFADVWDNINHRIRVDGSGVIQPVSLAVGTALAPFASNPSQTAAAGADTQYKFGAAGATSFNHVTIQNNGSISCFYAFDQSTTGATNQIYSLAGGQVAAWDRQGTILHFSSASPLSFGGQSGITVEAFV